MNNTMTLDDAKQIVLDGREKGVKCPCCGRVAKNHSKSFNETMARSLIWLDKAWQNTGRTWVNVPDQAPRWLIRSNQLATTRWWGLAESDPDRPQKGMWRPTEEGINFVKGLTRIPTKAVTYNGEVIRLSETKVSINQVLGIPFDRTETT